jgi:hypothetical protein
MSHFLYCYDECHYADYHCADCHCAECHFAEWHGADLNGLKSFITLASGIFIGSFDHCPGDNVTNFFSLVTDIAGK